MFIIAKPKTRRSISGRPPGMMRRQASLGSEDASNIRPQMLRQRSLTTPERDDAKNQSSPPLSELYYVFINSFKKA